MKAEKRRKKRMGFTNRLAVGILLEDAAVTGAVLLLSALCVRWGYTGALPFLTALIGLQQAKSGIVLTAVIGKSRAENTQGGIVYAAAVAPVNEEPDC